MANRRYKPRPQAHPPALALLPVLPIPPRTSSPPPLPSPITLSQTHPLTQKSVVVKLPPSSHNHTASSASSEGSFYTAPSPYTPNHPTRGGGGRERNSSAGSFYTAFESPRFATPPPHSNGSGGNGWGQWGLPVLDFGTHQIPIKFSHPSQRFGGPDGGDGMGCFPAYQNQPPSQPWLHPAELSGGGIGTPCAPTPIEHPDSTAPPKIWNVKVKLPLSKLTLQPALSPHAKSFTPSPPPPRSPVVHNAPLLGDREMMESGGAVKMKVSDEMRDGGGTAKLVAYQCLPIVGDGVPKQGALSEEMNGLPKSTSHQPPSHSPLPAKYKPISPFPTYQTLGTDLSLSLDDDEIDCPSSPEKEKVKRKKRKGLVIDHWDGSVAAAAVGGFGLGDLRKDRAARGQEGLQGQQSQNGGGAATFVGPRADQWRQNGGGQGYRAGGTGSLGQFNGPRGHNGAGMGHPNASFKFPPGGHRGQFPHYQRPEEFPSLNQSAAPIPRSPQPLTPATQAILIAPIRLNIYRYLAESAPKELHSMLLVLRDARGERGYQMEVIGCLAMAGGKSKGRERRVEWVPVEVGRWGMLWEGSPRQDLYISSIQRIELVNTPASLGASVWDAITPLFLTEFPALTQIRGPGTVGELTMRRLEPKQPEPSMPDPTPFPEFRVNANYRGRKPRVPVQVGKKRQRESLEHAFKTKDQEAKDSMRVVFEVEVGFYPQPGEDRWEDEDMEEWVEAKKRGGESLCDMLEEVAEKREGEGRGNDSVVGGSEDGRTSEDPHAGLPTVGDLATHLPEIKDSWPTAPVMITGLKIEWDDSEQLARLLSLNPDISKISFGPTTTSATIIASLSCLSKVRHIELRVPGCSITRGAVEAIANCRLDTLVLAPPLMEGINPAGGPCRIGVAEAVSILALGNCGRTLRKMEWVGGMQSDLNESARICETLKNRQDKSPILPALQEILLHSPQLPVLAPASMTTQLLQSILPAIPITFPPPPPLASGAAPHPSLVEHAGNVVRVLARKRVVWCEWVKDFEWGWNGYLEEAARLVRREERRWEGERRRSPGWRME